MATSLRRLARQEPLESATPARRDGPESRRVRKVALAICSPIASAIVAAMATTTMQLETRLRDELAEIAKNDFFGVPLAEALRRLIREHQINRIMARYAE